MITVIAHYRTPADKADEVRALLVPMLVEREWHVYGAPLGDALG